MASTPIRVDTTGTVAKTVDWWNLNPFTAVWLVPTLLVLAVWYLGLPRPLKSREAGLQVRVLRIYQFLLPLVALAFACWLLLEEYVMAQCPVSQERYEETHELFRRNVQVLEAHGITWWADDGTILSIIRGNKGFNPWDQDCDTYAIYQGSEWLGDLLDVLHVANHPHGVDVTYQPHRSQIQMSNPRGAHMDIWIWRTENDTPESRVPQLRRREHGSSFGGGSIRLNSGGRPDNPRSLPGPEEYLVNPDFTFSLYNAERFPVSMALPTTMVDWAGMKVRMPASPHDRARHQFGPNYMTPYFNRFMCLENIGTGRPSSTRKLVWFVLIGGAPIAAFLFAERIMSFMFRRRKGLSGGRPMTTLPA